MRLSLRALTLLAAAAAIAAPASAEPRPVRLVVQITVDQLRGDMPARLRRRFGPGGFRRLMDDGLWYSNAHYMHATTFTAVGHATLATGGDPAQHGLVGNAWLDPATGDSIYCVEDPLHAILGVRKRAGQGTSPRNLTSSTVGDELVLATSGAAKVFSVSIKDRGAILPGGHRGKAFWFHKSKGSFVTSTYYYAEPPAWFLAYNEAVPLRRYAGLEWRLAGPREEYTNADQDDRSSERPPKPFSRVFPHRLPEELEELGGVIATSPMGDAMTCDMALEVLRAEDLGGDEVPDLLCVSFSATDYIGHAFGPNSLEYEDNLIHLDRTLARLLAGIDAKVGLANTLIVLSADHGCDASPEHRKAVFQDARALPVTPEEEDDAKLPQAPDFCCQGGRHNPKAFVKAANEHLREAFKLKKGVDLVQGFMQPSLYLDKGAIATAKLDPGVVEAALAAYMRTVPGIAFAITRTQFETGQLPVHPVVEQLTRSYNADRSGQVLIVQRPFWYLAAYTGSAAMHGSPYPYDTHVPVMILGPGINPGRVVRRVAPEDIASTLSQWLDIPAPSGSIGEPLEEAFAPLRRRAF